MKDGTLQKIHGLLLALNSRPSDYLLVEDQARVKAALIELAQARDVVREMKRIRKILDAEGGQINCVAGDLTLAKIDRVLKKVAK